tara:strand:- start:138 stop:416 length:279 start_codon:yes stop_codon:yes gene_type:complete
MKAEIALIVLIILVLSYPYLLYFFTQRENMITIKSKKNYIVEDEYGELYRFPYLKILNNDGIKDYEDMKIGHTYKVTYFGLLYKYIFKYEEI